MDSEEDSSRRNNSMDKLRVRLAAEGYGMIHNPKPEKTNPYDEKSHLTGNYDINLYPYSTE